MFSNPLYLFALAGLALPVAIHLLHWKEGKVIKLGSLRHVLETNTKQFRGIKLNEILLLLLRCAMIVVFCFLLSGLQCSRVSKQRWALIEKGIEKIPDFNLVLDSLQKSGYELRCLAEGFPLLKDSSANDQINYWKLIDQLQSKPLSNSIVFAKNKIENFQGLREALPPTIRWISLPLPPTHFVVKATAHADSIVQRVGYSDATKTFFNDEKISTASNSFPVSSIDTVSVLLVADAAFRVDEKIVEAAFSAIEKIVPIKFKIEKSTPEQANSKSTEWLVWLSAQKIISSTQKIISIDPQLSQALFISLAPHRWIITKRLNEEIALNENFALRLATLMVPHKQQQEIARRNDRRMLSDAVAWSSVGVSKMEASMQHESANQYLILVLLALVIVERIMAYQKNQ